MKMLSAIFPKTLPNPGIRLPYLANSPFRRTFAAFGRKKYIRIASPCTFAAQFLRKICDKQSSIFPL
ncbi:MAG: hypothetical protein LBG47_00355 [Prevotellaceae bacterium]|jgi:hypothetical protein|nr:hypothetical protein [Prevotellaceae bacterium]